MNIETSSVFAELQTERLRLRQLNTQDAAIIHQLRTDEKVNKYIHRPAHRKDKDGLAFINRINTDIKNNQLMYWALCFKTNPKLIGTICLWNISEDKTTAEIGYDLFTEYQGKGIMSEAIEAILDFGFNNMKINSIEAFTHHENKNSIKLLDKFNFELDTSKIDEHNKNNVIYIKQQ